MDDYRRHVVVLLTNQAGRRTYTVINADPTETHFPHITFSLRRESANPYPSGSISITNLHELGAAALPGGVCVIRAGYYQRGVLPPIIFAGRPNSIESKWSGTDLTTTIGLGLPGELLQKVNIGPTGRVRTLANLLDELSPSNVHFDQANLRDQLKNLGEGADVFNEFEEGDGPPITVGIDYAVQDLPVHEWLTQILSSKANPVTAHYWQYIPSEDRGFARVYVWHQNRIDSRPHIIVRRVDMTALPAPKISLDGNTGIEFETKLDHRYRLSSGVRLEFDDPARSPARGFSLWRPVMIQHTGDNYSGNFRTAISARAIQEPEG